MALFLEAHPFATTDQVAEQIRGTSSMVSRVDLLWQNAGMLCVGPVAAVARH